MRTNEVVAVERIKRIVRALAWWNAEYVDMGSEWPTGTRGPRVKRQ